MKFPRFHLSTLLLFCVFCGACVGVWLAPPVWQVEWALPVKANRYTNLGAENIVFNASGTRLLAIQSGLVSLIDLTSRQVIWEMPVYCMSAKIRFIASGTIVQVVDAGFTPRLAELLGFTTFVNAIDGSKAAPPEPIPAWPELEAIDDEEDLFIRRNSAPDGTETCLAGYDSSGSPDSKSFFTIFQLEPNGDLRMESDMQRLQLPPGNCYSAAFSRDGNYLATGSKERVTFWRRTRAYGWRGLPMLPLFWVAALSFASLMMIFMRAVIRSWKLRKQRRLLKTEA